MRIKEFKINEKTRTVSLELKLNSDEVQSFDITRFKRLSDIGEGVEYKHDQDTVIRACFKVLDYPADMYGFVIDAKKSGRVAKVIEVRKLCMYQLRKHTDLTLVQIGKIFNLSHASVIFAVNSFSSQLDIGDSLCTLYDREVEYALDQILRTHV